MFTKGKGNSGSSEGSMPSFEPLSTNSTPAQRRPAGVSGPSIVNADVLIRGSITTKGELQMDGAVEGDVRARKLSVGGSIKGDVTAEEVVTIRGEVQGRIRGRRVELVAGCRVQGDILHAQLSIEPGAQFEGQVRYVQDPLASDGGAAAKPPTIGAPAAGAAPSSGGDKPNFTPPGGAAVA